MLLQRHSLELLGVAAQLRATSSGLYPPMRQQGVQWAVREAVADFGQANGCRVHLEVTLPNDVVVATEITTSIYHILRESLNNIRKHAGAKQVWVRLYEREGSLCLSIEDDGYASERMFMSVPDLMRNHHFGLAGMYEWASLAGGVLNLERTDDERTCVKLTIPPPWQAT